MPLSRSRWTASKKIERQRVSERIFGPFEDPFVAEPDEHLGSAGVVLAIMHDSSYKEYLKNLQ